MQFIRAWKLTLVGKNFMKILGMSGLLFGLLSMLLSVLVIMNSPDVFNEAGHLNGSGSGLRDEAGRFPPSIPFAIFALGISISAFKEKIGKYALFLALSSWVVIFTFFI